MYHFARVTNSPASREAAKWLRKVQDVQTQLAGYVQAERNGCLLTAADLRKQSRLEAKLEQLLNENPNEPA
jgi:hypothetical protein